MLDHLSKGRLEVGVGRGVSPFELNFHGIDHGNSREIFFDAFDCLNKALSGDTFSHDGKYFTYEDVPMSLRPLQQPHPAYWYGSSNTTGATWAGEQGMHFTANGQPELAKENIEAFRTALTKRGVVRSPRPSFRAEEQLACCDTSSSPIPTLKRFASRSLRWNITLLT